MDDLLARLDGDLIRIRALYRLARKRRVPGDELAALEALGKTFRTELDRFRSTWDPAERKEAVLSAGRILGRLDAWVATRGDEFAEVWKRIEGAKARPGRRPPLLAH